jgi:2-polyprenyl-3-methyl-5-hydroxy-6-metoxy-1,4-benzoquinol methylase
MQENKQTLSQKYFDDVYKANEDPWSFETSEYEKEKYKTTIDALPKNTYENAFEPGCSIGVLTQLLASKCKKLLAVDSAQAAVDKAKIRMQAQQHVTVAMMQVPSEFGSEQYDLIVLSEMAYYLNDKDLDLLKSTCLDHLQKGGHLIMVHYTPLVHDYPQTGDGVHDYFLKTTYENLKHLLHLQKETYRLDLFEKL